MPRGDCRGPSSLGLVIACHDHDKPAKRDERESPFDSKVQSKSLKYMNQDGNGWMMGDLGSSTYKALNLNVSLFSMDYEKKLSEIHHLRAINQTSLATIHTMHKVGAHQIYITHLCAQLMHVYKT